VLPAPDSAVAAAEAMHRTLDESAAGQPVTLVGRIALHAGPVIEKEGDVFGDAVNVAARLVALAKPRQILTSGDTVQLLPPALHGELRSLGLTRVKGRATELALHEWVWEKALVTKLVSRGPQAGKAVSLVVRAPGATVRVTAERPRITVGRQPFNDLVVEDDRVSRLHARIELRGSRFVLCDESSNGTHVMPLAGAPSVLRSEEGDLGTMGFFGLGAPPLPGQPHTVEYEVEYHAPEAAGAS
jgi:hypothetical protein